MKTCSVQTPNSDARRAFTLIEAMLAMAIAGLMVSIAMVNFAGAYRRSTFRGQLQDLVSNMQRAARAAHQSGRRYEIVINRIEHKYILREISSGNLEDVLAEEIIAEHDFSEDCYIEGVLFDDPDLDEAMAVGEELEEAKFRVGPNGWAFGGKIVFSNEQDGRIYSVVVEPLSRIVTLQNGDVEILTSKRKDELPF